MSKARSAHIATSIGVLDVGPGYHLSAVGGSASARLTLLGEPAVDGQPLGSPASRYARIVAYLALHRPTTRARLAAALWPDAEPERAQGSLRTGLWTLHRRHPGLVLVGTLVQLRPDLSVDYHELTRTAHRLLHEVAAGDDVAVDRAAELLRLAADTELLPGWDEEWVVHDQERFRQLRLHMLEGLSAQLCRQGVYGMALEAALAALGGDRLRESAYRAVIEVHLAEGNVSEARRQYRTCLRLLHAELGVLPSQATVRLGHSLGVVPPATRPGIYEAGHRRPSTLAGPGALAAYRRAGGSGGSRFGSGSLDGTRPRAADPTELGPVRWEELRQA